MNILHIASIDNYKASGISVIVPQHLKYQKKHVNVALLNCSKTPLSNTKEDYGFKTFKFYEYNKFELSKLEYPFNNPDLVVFHSIYYKEFCKISKKLRGMGLPYIVIPHGSLTNLAQKKKFLKKKIGNILFFNNFIKKCNYIQYLTSEEEKSSSKWNMPFLICGNGIDINDEFVFNNLSSRKSFNIVFIGRLDVYHKGLDVLLEACSLIRTEMLEKQIILDIYGPDYQDGRKKVKEMIKNLDLENVVFLHNEVYDDKKDRVLSNADIFILTSRFEGQPLAIMEALAKGIPVIATPGTNFSEEIEKNELGWKVELSSEDIAHKILDIYKQKDLLSSYSVNAYEYAKDNLSWDKITKDTINLYKQLFERE